jgi:hypothetical protein
MQTNEPDAVGYSLRLACKRGDIARIGALLGNLHSASPVSAVWRGIEWDDVLYSAYAGGNEEIIAAVENFIRIENLSLDVSAILNFAAASNKLSVVQHAVQYYAPCGGIRWLCALWNASIYNNVDIIRFVAQQFAALPPEMKAAEHVTLSLLWASYFHKKKEAFIEIACLFHLDISEMIRVVEHIGFDAPNRIIWLRGCANECAARQNFAGETGITASN